MFSFGHLQREEHRLPVRGEGEPLGEGVGKVGGDGRQLQEVAQQGEALRGAGANDLQDLGKSQLYFLKKN